MKYSMKKILFVIEIMLKDLGIYDDLDKTFRNADAIIIITEWSEYLK